MELWRAYYDKLSNNECPWVKDTLKKFDAVTCPCEISFEEVKA